MKVPIVSYGGENWPLTLREKHSVGVEKQGNGNFISLSVVYLTKPFQ
jgi:hypothetical protein